MLRKQRAKEPENPIRKCLVKIQKKKNRKEKCKRKAVGVVYKVPTTMQEPPCFLVKV